MIKKVCDLCKRAENKEMIIDYMASIQLEKLSGWDYILGRKMKLEICVDCFERILREYEVANPHQS